VEVIFKVPFGWLIGRMYLCRAAGCNVKARLLYSIAAGAFFGAAIAYAMSS